MKPPDRSEMIAQLKAGNIVKFSPVGDSMTPVIFNGDVVTLCPNSRYEEGNIVYCRIGRRNLLHFVKSVTNGKATICNVDDIEDGIADEVYGVVTEIEHNYKDKYGST